MPKYTKAQLARQQEIIAYWETRVYDEDVAVDWHDAHERCWRCGYERKLEFCHIVPKSLGGGLAPDNMVLLCGDCHIEGPNVSDSDAMWRWIKATNVGSYDTYWNLRAQEEYKRIFSCDPLVCLRRHSPWPRLNAAVFSVDTERKLKLYKRLQKKVWEDDKEWSRHFGERVNLSTKAFLTRRVETELLNTKYIHQELVKNDALTDGWPSLEEDAK